MPARQPLAGAAYALGLSFAAACFYFSIANNLFVWLFPDELASYNAYIENGLFGCAKYYYLETTINRVSADFGICGMASLQTWIGTPYLGWVAARLIFYVLVPICLAFLFKEFAKVSYVAGLTAALLVSSAAFFMTAHPEFYLFGLDLAIYGTLTFSFFMLFAWFPKAVQTRRDFVWFCLFFALNLGSHEIALVMSGFFIPLYAWHRYLATPGTDGKFIFKKMLADKGTQILSAIYIISAALALFAPSMRHREKIWPSTGTFTDSVWHMFLSMEEATYLLSRSYVLLMVVILLGFCIRLGYAKQYKKSDRLLYGYLFIAPIAYVAVTGFLLGTTPSLQAGSARPEAFRIVESLFATKRPIFDQGAFAVRQNLFLYASACVDMFFAGFFIAGRWAKAAWLEKSAAYRFSFGGIIVVLFLLHPGAIGSIRLLHALIGNDSLEAQNIQEPSQSQAIIQSVFPHNYMANTAPSVVFARPFQASYETAMMSILTDNYLRHNRLVPSGILDPIYNSMAPGYRGNNTSMWTSQIYTMYGVTPKDAER